MNTDAEVRLHLVCISGPDQGKRLAVGPDEAIIGRAPECGLRSDDPEVAERHVGLRLLNGALRYRALDGIEQASGDLAPAQQLRIGRSYWRLEGRGPALDPGGLLDTVGRQGNWKGPLQHRCLLLVRSDAADDDISNRGRAC